MLPDLFLMLRDGLTTPCIDCDCVGSDSELSRRWSKEVPVDLKGSLERESSIGSHEGDLVGEFTRMRPVPL